MKGIIRNFGAAVAGLMPYKLSRELFRAWLVSLNRQEARKALTGFFGLADDLTDRINSAAIRHEGGVHPKHRLTGYHAFFTERVEKGDRVLDVGCGNGELAWDLVRVGAKVVGVDINPQTLEKARAKLHPDLTFVRADITAELPPGVFDLIVMSNVLEHIDDRIGLLRKLKDTGASRFLIRVPAFDRSWTVPFRKELGLFHFSDSTHFIEYTSPELTTELGEAGLEISHAQYNWAEIWAEAVVRNS